MITSQDPLFSPAKFFMARTPLMPIDDFFLFLQHENWSDFLFDVVQNDPLFKEALAIATPSLVQAVTNKKESSQTVASLLRYFSRATSRSTPFGLFSCVSLGVFSEFASAKLDLSKVSKRARPDMEWLLSVIEQLCQDPSLFPSLLVRCNPLAYASGGRIFLDYIRKEKEEEKGKIFSIRASFLTQAIFEMTKTPISISELIAKIIQSHPSLEKEKILNMLKQLVKQQFLCFMLLPSLQTDSPLADLLSKLSSLPLHSHPLHEIATKIREYNNTGAGEGAAELQQLQNEMNVIANASHTIQVDSVHTGEQATLPSFLGDELSDAAEIMWRVSAAHPLPSLLQSYHLKFLDKYGVCREVPLLELLNEGIGLGVPEQYLGKMPESVEKDGKNSKWKKWLHQALMESLHQRKKEIILTKEIFEKFVEKTDETKAPLSFDLFCEIISNSAQHVDRGDYLLHVSSFSWQGGAAFGRFLDLFGKPAKDMLRAFYVEEESLEPQKIFAQSSYLSFQPRNANVSIHPNLRRNGINLEGGGNISFEDVHVGATLERLYLKTKDSQQELIVVSDNMLTSHVAPVPIRFMLDVSRNRHLPVYGFNWTNIQESPFYPRVRFKKTIFSPAKWRVDPFQLSITAKDSLEKIEKEFQSWAAKWELPRYCFMGDGDIRILIDTGHPACLREIAQNLKQSREIIFTEKIGQTDGEWVESRRGKHLSEFIVPFKKNQKFVAAKPTYAVSDSPLYKSIPLNERFKLLGSEWLYAKCYLPQDQENRFLIDHFQCFLDFLLKNALVEEGFFIRYADPNPHLRFRFRGNRERICNQLIPAIHDWTSDLLNKRLIRELTFSSYEREIERYGGETLIELAEAFFCADSTTALSLINALLQKKILVSEEAVASLSLIDLMKRLGLELTDTMNLLLSSEKEGIEGFREVKAKLLSFSEAILDNRLADHSEEGAILASSFSKKRSSHECFCR